MKLGLFLIAVIVCLSASAAKSVLPPPPPGAVTPEEAQQRLQERQRRRQDTPQPEPKPAPAKAAAPDPTVKALALKQGAPEAVREWFARLPAIQAAYVDSLAADARRLEAESLQVERQPVPRVRVGGVAFGTTEYGPDEAAGRAKSRRLKEMKFELREMNLQVELARQDRTFIHVPALALEIGSFGEVASAHVSRIIDGQNMLAAVLGKEVWVSGIPTQGVVDGETVKIGRTMVVSRTRKATGRTVFMLEPLDLKEWVEVIEQHPLATPPAEQVAAQVAAQKRVQRGNPMPKAGDAVADAINEHRLIREMTPVQAAEAMGVKAQWQTDTDEGATMTWEFRAAGRVVRRVTAWFEDGRLTHFEDQKVQ